MGPAETGVVEGHVVVDHRGPEILVGGAMATPGMKFLRPPFAPGRAGEGGTAEDPGEGNVEHENRDDGRGGEGDKGMVLQRPPADAPGGLDDNGGHRRLDAVKNSRHQGYIAEG